MYICIQNIIAKIHVYLYTEQVYNYKLVIILTVYMYKAIRWKIAFGCFDYFFPPNFNNDNKTF